MNYGYQNEEDFVKLFNDKYFYELDNSGTFLEGPIFSITLIFNIKK